MFKNEHFFHHNVRHIVRLVPEFLENFDLTLLNLPYNSDLAPCDFGLFPFIKETLNKTKIFE